jgi:hypothetical protein
MKLTLEKHTEVAKHVAAIDHHLQAILALISKGPEDAKR